ncbi:class I SAM-dependent methyltransferase [Patescibacteria group bacterium]
MNNYKRIKTYYDKFGSRYDSERIEGYYSFINEIEIDIVKKYGKGKKTLEIGCGTGIILNEVNKFAKEAIGIDLSSGMLEDAKKKGLNVKRANATKLPFGDKSFDVVYSFKVLAHIPEIEKVISETHRVLKDDGIAILEFYNPYSIKYIANNFSRASKKVFLRFDSLAKVKELLKKTFTLINVKGARIITPSSFFFRIPILKDILSQAEKLLSQTVLNRFAGYLIVIAKKK